ncbi:MAG: hypothetical protein V3W37_07920 [Candidatus Binatia bacterium]
MSKTRRDLRGGEARRLFTEFRQGVDEPAFWSPFLAYSTRLIIDGHIVIDVTDYAVLEDPLALSDVSLPPYAIAPDSD